MSNHFNLNEYVYKIHHNINILSYLILEKIGIGNICEHFNTYILRCNHYYKNIYYE